MSVKYLYIEFTALIMNKRQMIAIQNRELLLNAAIHIFRQHGINAPLQLIIDQAQLGRATFYRNFTDRRDLVLALMHQALARLEAKATHFSQYPDGFLLLLKSHIHNLPYLTALMEYWRVIESDDPELKQIYVRRNQILQPLIDSAIHHKVCRADLTCQDYALVTALLRASFQGVDEAAQIRLAERAIELLINGIQA